MKNFFFKLENQFKRVLYKKYLLAKDVQMVIQGNDLNRVLRMVPKHSEDLFLAEIKKHTNSNINS